MTIKIIEHAELPPIYICPTCLQPTVFLLGQRWQVCGEKHFTETRCVGLVNETGYQAPTHVAFANGEARRPIRKEEPKTVKWAEAKTPFGNITE